MILRTIFTAVLGVAMSATSLAHSPANAQTWGWTPKLVICNPAGCREAPDPYWEGPARVQRPCRDWQQCYWRQRWW
jgi:hypothetical protein